MTKLTKDLVRSVIAGRVGRAAVAGTPSRPAYSVTTTFMIDDPAYVPTMPGVATRDLTTAEIKSTSNIKIASFDEVAKIPELSSLAKDVRAGNDPGEVRWAVAVNNIIKRERNSGTLGKVLVNLPRFNGWVPYLAVWSMGQGCGIYRFDGYTNLTRPTMKINPRDTSL